MDFFKTNLFRNIVVVTVSIAVVSLLLAVVIFDKRIMVFAMAANLIILLITVGILMRTLKQQIQENEILRIKAKQTAGKITDTEEKVNKRDSLNRGLLKLNSFIHNDQSISSLSEKICAFICNYTKAHVGVLFEVDYKKEILKFSGSFPQKTAGLMPDEIKFGYGRCGQAVLDKEIAMFTGQPAGYLKIATSMGSSSPENVVIFPVVFKKKVVAVVEIGSFVEFSNFHREFFVKANDTLAYAIRLNISRTWIDYLIYDAQNQSKAFELQAKEIKKSKEESEKLKKQRKSLTGLRLL